jgi:hypothetical protein
MDGWIIFAAWLIALLLWAYRWRKSVNGPWTVLALGGFLSRAGWARFRRGGSGFGGGGFPSPHDPFSDVRHPTTRRPGGNSAAVAVEDEALTLVGRSK